MFKPISFDPLLLTSFHYNLGNFIHGECLNFIHDWYQYGMASLPYLQPKTWYICRELVQLWTYMKLQAKNISYCWKTHPKFLVTSINTFCYCILLNFEIDGADVHVITTEYKTRVNCIHMLHLICNALVHLIYSGISGQSSHTIHYTYSRRSIFADPVYLLL